MKQTAAQKATDAYYKLREKMVTVDDFTDGEPAFTRVRRFVKAMMRASDRYQTAQEVATAAVPRIGADVVVSIARDAKRKNFDLQISSPSTGGTVHFTGSTATLKRILSDIGDQLERLDQIHNLGAAGK